MAYWEYSRIVSIFTSYIYYDKRQPSNTVWLMNLKFSWIHVLIKCDYNKFSYKWDKVITITQNMQDVNKDMKRNLRLETLWNRVVWAECELHTWHGIYPVNTQFLSHLSAFQWSQILVPSESSVLTLVYLLTLHVCRRADTSPEKIM
jgi:hypothetical protein